MDRKKSKVVSGIKTNFGGHRGERFQGFLSSPTIQTSSRHYTKQINTKTKPCKTCAHTSSTATQGTPSTDTHPSTHQHGHHFLHANVKTIRTQQRKSTAHTRAQREGGGCTLDGVDVRLDLLEGGNEEGGGLAGAVLCSGQNVAPKKRNLRIGNNKKYLLKKGGEDERAMKPRRQRTQALFKNRSMHAVYRCTRRHDSAQSQTNNQQLTFPPPPLSPPFSPFAKKKEKRHGPGWLPPESATVARSPSQRCPSTALA